MKNKKDIMHVTESYNKRNELRFILHASYKDPLSKKYKVCVKTYAVPRELKGKKEIEDFRLKCQLDLKDELAHIGEIDYIPEKELNMKFCDYAEMWVENILKNNNESYQHYSHCKNNLKVFKEKFNNYSLQDMTRNNVKKFCDWLNVRKYKKEEYVVKSSLIDLIKSKKLKLVNVAKFCDISTTTLSVALCVGNKVEKKTAVNLCDFLEVSINRYFNISVKEVQYSKNSNRAIKVMLSSVLKQAKMDGYIEENYASSDYIKPISGGMKEREIIKTKEELKNFISCVNNEEDIRKRTAFYIAISLGLRGCEISGLSWSDIDFNDNLVKIHKGTMYVCGFGVITKMSAKNKTSNRIISMPDSLVVKLKEYKLWWDNEKEKMGDLWAETDKLFVRSDGSEMPNSTIAHWLKEFEIKNNLKNITFHGLRHTNITFAIANNVDVKTVSSRAGHSNIQTTINIYTHYLPESDKKASQVIDNLLVAE